MQQALVTLDKDDVLKLAVRRAVNLCDDYEDHMNNIYDRFLADTYSFSAKHNIFSYIGLYDKAMEVRKPQLSDAFELTNAMKDYDKDSNLSNPFYEKYHDDFLHDNPISQLQNLQGRYLEEFIRLSKKVTAEGDRLNHLLKVLGMKSTQQNVQLDYEFVHSLIAGVAEDDRDI